MRAPLTIDLDSVKGFLDPREGDALYQLAREHSTRGPCLEIGSYCGKSTLYLATACKETGALLYAIDHHRGSEEHQVGEAYHDPDLYDTGAKAMDSFREFRWNLRRAALEEYVVPIVAQSEAAARHWCTGLSLVFIDGGHSEAAALADYRAWAPRVMPGGILAIHDIFFDPEEGGQAPRMVYDLAIASGLFEPLPMVHTLGILRRI
ncbi:MAG: class I SAM-dependent methyltransferase [Pseudomonadota bacterium]|nr:class I SAM-dependent methyltransferase [Pseudomonadota bacterium]